MSARAAVCIGLPERLAIERRYRLVPAVERLVDGAAAKFCQGEKRNPRMGLRCVCELMVPKNESSKPIIVNDGTLKPRTKEIFVELHIEIPKNGLIDV
jgi:hypothetical protein